MMISTIVTRVNMYRDSDSPFFGESVTEISLEDEAAGAFVKLVQHYGDREHILSFDLDEIDALCLNLQSFKEKGIKLLE